MELRLVHSRRKILSRKKVSFWPIKHAPVVWPLKSDSICNILGYLFILGDEIVTNLPLQMALYFNVVFFPFWFIVMITMLYLKVSNLSKNLLELSDNFYQREAIAHWKYYNLTSENFYFVKWDFSKQRLSFPWLSYLFYNILWVRASNEVNFFNNSNTHAITTPLQIWTQSNPMCLVIPSCYLDCPLN